ncbi:MAG: carboxymuconolactone decarboxylase family protein [Bacteroidetes bacterium]|nr:MAG: carboxymuconolactone decarboxylase family protein [Bacteroidota bacterium]RLD87947.1 MAG: carboxymuconolactone decarboxylase family protein [Bacteroidota bacterium]RLD94972.1 MAG: carboxymuconolactone decarboxylase family protein [Bacteroidota bacterium]
MRNFIKYIIRRLIFIIPVLLIPITISAQSSDAYETAKKEIEQTFGTFLSMFEAIPVHALPGAWDNFKQLQSPENAIPPKYRELMQLSVAAQIPCEYCVYYHITVAKAFGATDEEIKEAVAHGAQTRQWSMVLQGNQIELEDFKAEVDAALIYMSEQAGK